MPPRTPPGIELFRRLVEHSPDVIFRIRLGSRPYVEYVNPAVTSVTGYPPEAWYDDPSLAARVFHPADRRKFLDVVRTKRVSRLPQLVRVVAQDGREVTVEVRATAIRGQDGSLKAIEGFGREIPAGSREPDVAAELAHRQAPANAALERLEYQGITLDGDRLQVLLDDRPVPLTLKEVLLLRYLIRHRGEMLPRERVLHDVWGYGYSGRSRTLDVHVCRLRRKLPPLANALVTVGHFGYTLSEVAPTGTSPSPSPV